MEERDRVRTLFACCHPSLGREARVALTLRLACGVEIADIARVFLVPEQVMAARLADATRAKERLPDRMPFGAELPERLDAVLDVVHLLYTTGHTATEGDVLVRGDVVALAVELAEALHELMPDEVEVRGLLALLLVTDARRAARTDGEGRLVTLEDQDRATWDRAAIDEGRRLVAGALRAGRPGRFTLQAAIATVHASAPSFARTDWSQIVVLYDELLEAWPSPVVALNRAIALGMADGPAAALAELDALDRDGALAGYRYLPAARADMLRRLGRHAEAAAAYRDALALQGNGPEREFLLGRLAEVVARA
ncbi:RNA polymerase sigma factor [Amycolatopsis sp. CA-230715]|uniref:RNA polymerase sigma factor n=1 Tax=Amycolatopsis sp. CA-230715 TaxID=2745196 RepID=UPI001C034DA7|nr:DUF6596 domain-containing protein [Amycolatopsis sp. CA-230715]QWF81819.1 hypothetical protein HUW46_05252 [Amycolatopsis sp. CA-230715]